MADKKIHLSYEDYLNLALDIPGRPKCLTNYVIYNWIDGGYYNLNTYSYYIYLPNEFVSTGTYQVQLIKLIRYQTGANLQSAKTYVDNAKNNGLNEYVSLPSIAQEEEISLKYLERIILNYLKK